MAHHESLPGARFADPAPTHRVMAFWSLNGDLTEEGITRWLTEFAERGMGGAFMHPRPGLVTEYLSERWWELWAHALAEAKRLGLHLQIYDENSYPSGFAGGHVPSRDPWTVATHVSLVPLASVEHARLVGAVGFVAADGTAISRDEAVALFDAGTSVDDATTPDSRPVDVAAVVASRATPRAFSAGFGYVDLTLPDTTRHFLATTHEEYWRRFRDDFGGAIEYAFTDEPNPHHADGFAVNDLLYAEFADEHGYRLEESWAGLWFGDGAVRYDYFTTLNRLFLDNFVTPINEWCRERGIGFTGHFWEHSWPSPGKQPNNMAAMARMDVPSNDLLEFQINRPDFWPKAVLNLKELASVASQTGATRTMVENGGAGGYDVGPWNFRRTDNTLLAFGVTGFTAHLSHYSLAGTRKYEWPQTLGEPASWWKHYRPHGDHVARVTSLLVASEERNEVALIEPTRSGWLHYAPPSLAAVAPELAAKRNERLAKLESDFTSLVLDLFERGIGFDLLDEEALESATIEDDRLVVGKRSYACVAVAASTETLSSGSFEALARLAGAGGTVALAGELPLVNGRARTGGEAAAAPTVGDALRIAGDALLAEELGRRFPSTHLRARVEPGSAWHRRRFADGSILYLFANSTDAPVTFQWRPEAPDLYELDTDDGAAYPLPAGDQRTVVPARGLVACLAGESEAERLGFTIGKPTDRDARMRVITGTAGAVGRPGAAGGGEPREVRLTAARRLEPNALVIDYCAIARRPHAAGDDARQPVHHLAADETLWKWAGASGNLWDRAIQFRTTTLNRTYRHLAPRVTYSFTVADAAALEAVSAGLTLVVERAELWTISVNGMPVAPGEWKPWRIDDFHAAGIAGAVRVGENRIDLSADAFHPLMEISPIMLFGDFGLRAAERGFEIVAPTEIGVGDANATLPFYPGDLEYDLEPGDGAREVEIPFAGAYAEVKTDGGERVLALESPALVRLPAAGSRTLTIRVGASAQNLFGPFHSEGLALSFTWAKSPTHQPPGSDYAFVPHGLASPVAEHAPGGTR